MTFRCQNYQLHISEDLQEYSFNTEEVTRKHFHSPPISVTSSNKEMQSTGFMLVLIINIFLQSCSGEGTHYFKANSIQCHTTEKLSIKLNDQTICAAVCDENEDKLCMGFRSEDLSCELCTVCPETTTRNISMFSINYQNELNKGRCAFKAVYIWLFEN